MYALVMFVQLWNVYFVILQYAGCFIANTSNSLLLNGLISDAGIHAIIFFTPQNQAWNAPPINSNQTKRQSHIKNILPMKKIQENQKHIW